MRKLLHLGEDCVVTRCSLSEEKQRTFKTVHTPQYPNTPVFPKEVVPRVTSERFRSSKYCWMFLKNFECYDIQDISSKKRAESLTNLFYFIKVKKNSFLTKSLRWFQKFDCSVAFGFSADFRNIVMSVFGSRIPNSDSWHSPKLTFRTSKAWKQRLRNFWLINIVRKKRLFRLSKSENSSDAKS